MARPLAVLRFVSAELFDPAGPTFGFAHIAEAAAGPLSLFDPAGTALVIPAAPDDQVSRPIGGSGARLACGVLASR